MKMDDSKKPLVILGCVIAIFVSIGFIIKTSCRSQPAYSPSVDRCVGERMAAEVGKLLDGQGDVVVLSMAGNKFRKGVADAQIDGLTRGFKPYSGIKIQVVVSPEEGEMGRFFDGVSEQFFLEAVNDHPNARAIVSFMGLPILAREGSQIDPAKLPKVVALNLSAMGQWQDLVKAGVVSAVILPRYDVQWDKLPKKGDCHALFDARYLVVTKDNIEEMSEKLEKFYPTR